jgi:hypothetical protein
LRSLDSSVESKINPYKLELSSPHLNLLLTMSALMESSLPSMKAAFPTAHESIHGIPTLAFLINLMMHMCRRLQTQKTPASATMNMLFLAVSAIGRPLGIPCMKKEEEQLNIVLFCSLRVGDCQNWYKI